MQKRTNRFLRMLLALAMLLAVLPAAVFAEGETAATVSDWNVTLGDNIGVNFYVTMDEASVDSTSANITVAGTTTTLKASEVPTEDGCYVFSADLAAAQMTDTISLELVTGETQVYTGEYSVRGYADTVLEGEYDQEVKDMVLAMLNYGAKAQTYFAYNTDDLANAGYEDAVTAATMPESVEDMSLTGKVSGIRYYGATLVFGSKTAVRYYFKVTGDVNAYTFSVGETTYNAQAKDDRYYVEVDGIDPQDLADQITLTVSDGTDSLAVTYGPMNYITRMYNSGSESLKDLLQALYDYHLEAVEYQKYLAIIQVGTLSAHDNDTLWENSASETCIYFNTDAYTATTGGYAPTTTDAIKLVRDGVTYDVAVVGSGTIVKDDDTQHLVKLTDQTISGSLLPLQATDYLIIEGMFTSTADSTRIQISKSYIYYNGTTVVISATEPVIEPADKFAIAFPDTVSYLYRVGNKNAIKLGSLFKAVEGAQIGNVSISVTPCDESISVPYTYTANAADWTQGTIQFTGTGPVTISIDDDAYANEKLLQVEVIDAYNVTSYSELQNRNSVLLNDITMSSGSSYALTGSTLYGNGFTFDVTDGRYAGTSYVSSNYLVYLSNAALDNVQIVGAVYTQYGAQASSDYNNPVVLSVGNSTITNCYIANCAAPVRVNGGNLTIENTTLKGGNFANLDIRNGHVVLNDVTTINQKANNDTAEDGTTVIGLGIVAYYEQVLDTTTIEINGTLTQYNYLSASDAESVSDSYAQTLLEVMFSSNFADLQYNDGTDTWVNTGIISMTETVDADNIIDNRSSHSYVLKNASVSSYSGYVYTAKPTAVETAPAYETAGQGAIAPTYSFDYTSKNYVAKTEGSNDYCYEDNGTVLLSMDEGDTVNWDTSILTAEKLGQSLSYTVTMDGTDYTGKTIPFSQSGSYTVTYTYTDNNNYRLDGSGKIETYAVTYTKNVHIAVSVVKPDAKTAEFAFGSSGTAGKTVTIGNDTYVMPDVSATSSSFGSITVSGTTVYYTVVDAYTSDGATAHTALNSWYMCYPVFKNVVTITDYANGGTGDAVTYGSSTTSLPSGLSVNAYSAYSTSLPSGSVSFTTGGADVAFKYQASASASSTPATLDSVLIYKSPTLSNNARKELYLLIQYKYQDNTGAAYYYYVGYHMPETTVKSGCVTGDTLVTLADGTQKEIQRVTYEDELLVWDFVNGRYTTTTSAVIANHGYADNTVIKLTFSDGTVVKAINEHGFFDADLNEYVMIDAGNAQDHVGHKFVQADGDGYKTVELVDCEVTEEYIASYSILSAQYYNCLMENMFSLTSPVVDGNFFMPFKVGANMKYDEEAMIADIEQYGLYTYEDFEGILTYEQFVALNAGQLKVAVGKGIITWEELLWVIETQIPVE